MKIKEKRSKIIFIDSFRGIWIIFALLGIYLMLLGFIGYCLAVFNFIPNYLGNWAFNGLIMLGIVCFLGILQPLPFSTVFIIDNDSHEFKKLKKAIITYKKQTIPIDEIQDILLKTTQVYLKLVNNEIILIHTDILKLDCGIFAYNLSKYLNKDVRNFKTKKKIILIDKDQDKLFFRNLAGKTNLHNFVQNFRGKIDRKGEKVEIYGIRGFESIQKFLLQCSVISILVIGLIFGSIILFFGKFEYLILFGSFLVITLLIMIINDLVEDIVILIDKESVTIYTSFFFRILKIKDMRLELHHLKDIKVRKPFKGMYSVRFITYHGYTEIAHLNKDEAENLIAVIMEGMRFILGYNGSMVLENS